PAGPPHGPGHGDREAPSQASSLREEERRQSYIPRIFNVAGVAMRPYQNVGAWDGMAVRRAVLGAEIHSTVTIDGEPVRVLTRPVRWRGQVLGAVQAAHPLSETRQAITVVNQTLLALIPVGLLFAGLAGAVVTGRALRPVGRIASTADRIDAEDLSQRLETVGDDEFSHLAGTVNRMLGRLEGAFSKQRALVAQLEALLAEQKRFTADASHELKTPLAVAKVHAGLLLQDSDAGPSAHEVRESAEAVNDAVDRMTRLVQDLLLLAQADAAPPKPHTSLIVRDILSQARALQSPNPRPRVRIDAGDPSITVMGCEDELVRVFANLLANARRHTPPEGEIRVCAERRGDQIVVRVADIGEGIAPEHLPRLGDRFYRIDTARGRDQGGAGLGLSICRSLLERHGGNMRFDSVLGEGTTVTVTLPAER
ncbi:MAG TPA: HAMP domain-containing sensor histidine kinase, partial [Chthonomonadaceae bacterium]|nr:HAMP domain-containing sensor histidine kinase [Chthonomonadaceae bacterium]